MAASRRVAVAAAILGTLLTACGTSSPTASNTSPPATSSRSATSPAPRAETSAAGSGSAGSETAPPAAFPASTAPDGGPAQAGATADPTGQMHVTALRLGEHPTYSRLVVDLSGAGVPKWRVAYGEKTGPGGGPVTLAGDAFLRLSLMTGAEPGVQTSSSVTGSGLIAQARTTGFFEGYEEVLVGVTGGRLPFRAFALTDPGRIVIDVR
jgi:hypothetical protein